jgi:hypothetical protein
MMDDNRVSLNGEPQNYISDVAFDEHSSAPSDVCGNDNGRDNTTTSLPTLAQSLAPEGGGSRQEGAGILSIAVLPYVDPKQHRFTDPAAGASSSSSNSELAKEKLAAYKIQATNVLARFAPNVAQAMAATDIHYVITSRIAAEFACANSPRSGATSASGTAASRCPRIYRVRRNLEHLIWFRSMMCEKVPYGVVNPLPVTKEDAYSRDGVDQVVAFLSIFASCAELKGDPLFWSLLTKPDDEFQELFVALKPSSSSSSGASTTNTAHSGIHAGSTNDPSESQSSPPTSGFSARGMMGAIQKKLMSQAKKLAAPKYPSKALKPDKISDMLMETGVIDRALMSLDKVNSCVKTSYYFEDEKAQNGPREKAWEEAAQKAFLLRDALEEERDALIETANALRDLAFPSYWPWTRDCVMEELRPTTSTSIAIGFGTTTPAKQQSAETGQEGLADSTQAVAPSSPQSLGTPASPQIARPPPSQRLTHYLHRVANAAQEMGRLSLLIFGEEFAISVNLVRMTISARTLSASTAHERIFSLEHQPRPKGRGLCDIQALLNKLVAEGTGHEELDAFDAMDDEVTAIHEETDEAVNSFERHHGDALRIMHQRLGRDMKEMIVGQVVNWKSALLLLADLKTTLELDQFLDGENLPFTNAPVVHNPSPLQKRRFEAQQQVWGQQVTAFNEAQQEGTTASTATKSSKGGFGALLESRGQPKRRQALQYDDEGTTTGSASGGNPFDTEMEMTPASLAGAGATSGGSPKGTGGTPKLAGDNSAALRRDNSLHGVLPDELIEVVNSQSKFLLERPSNRKAASMERPTEEAAFDDDDAKHAAKRGSWKRTGGAASKKGWGGVAEDDEEDPFRF